MLTIQGKTLSPYCAWSPLKLIITAIMFLNCIDHSIAIRCYKCDVTVEKIYVNNTAIITPMCSKFYESDEYIVECPFSTMCLKTISTLYLQNGQKQETVTRGCAQQKDTTQVFRDRQWQQKHSVQEVYDESCGEFKENNLAGSVKTHCYCRGELCNAASRLNSISEVKAFVVIFLFYIYSSY